MDGGRRCGLFSCLDIHVSLQKTVSVLSFGSCTLTKFWIINGTVRKPESVEMYHMNVKSRKDTVLAKYNRLKHVIMRFVTDGVACNRNPKQAKHVEQDDESQAPTSGHCTSGLISLQDRDLFI